MVDALSATNAYRNQLKMMQDAPPVQDEAAASPFADLVQQAIREAEGTQQGAEMLELQSLTGSGKVDLANLVTAVADAELSLNTVVAVRDRVINAYNDIIKMPI